MKTDSITYTVPSWAVCAIEYGDLDGLSTDDITALDAFMDTLPRRILGIDYGDSFFSYFNDIDNLGNDCVEAVVNFEVKK